MCDQNHATFEEALACRNKERERRGDELVRRFERYQNIELALSDALSQIERAKRERNPALVLENDGLIDQIKRALS